MSESVEDVVLCGLATLYVAFQRTPADEEADNTYKAYLAGLSDLSAPAIKKGFAESLRRCKFFPRIADIREWAGVPTEDQLAALAYSEADRAARQQGSYKSIEFDDPALTATIRTLGGWVAFCGSDPANTYYAKQFQDTYRGFLRSGAPKELTGYLPGIHELDPNNANYRHRLAAPVKVACLSTSGVKRLGGAA